MDTLTSHGMNRFINTIQSSITFDLTLALENCITIIVFSVEREFKLTNTHYRIDQHNMISTRSSVHVSILINELEFRSDLN